MLSVFLPAKHNPSNSCTKFQSAVTKLQATKLQATMKKKKTSLKSQFVTVLQVYSKNVRKVISN